jgi:hypothetical protein
LAVQGIVPVGNRAILIGNRNRIRRQLATSVGGVFDAESLVENQDEIRLVGRDGKNVYLSFVQRISKVNDGRAFAGGQPRSPRFCSPSGS